MRAWQLHEELRNTTARELEDSFFDSLSGRFQSIPQPSWPKESRSLCFKSASAFSPSRPRNWACCSEYSMPASRCASFRNAYDTAMFFSIQLCSAALGLSQPEEQFLIDGPS